MKVILKFSTIFLLTLFLFACEEEKPSRGLVGFVDTPVYEDGFLRFTVYIQYGREGQEVECEYQVLDGPFIVDEGIIPLSNREVSGVIWTSQPQQIEIDSISYFGRSLLVDLDPQNKITSESFREPQLIEFYKQETVSIP
jgi:hypothetical protein